MIPTKKNIYLSAGGTGGHVFPALSLARLLIERGDRPILLTDARGRQMVPPMEGLQVEELTLPSWVGGWKKKLRFGWDLLKSLNQLRQLWKKTPVDAVVGFGGYPALPVMMVAMMQGRPLMLHEQNAYLGKVNHFASRCARLIAVSFEKTRGIPQKDWEKVTLAGLPVRHDIQKVREGAYRPPDPHEPFRLLIVGGSQGASVFAKLIPDAIALLPPSLRDSLLVTHQVRKEQVQQVRGCYERLGVSARVEVFFHGMADELARAHLVIARGGASTIFELIAAARPALLVPLPSSANDHQRYNAAFFEEMGGGFSLAQHCLTPEGLAEILTQFIENPVLLKEKSDQLMKLSYHDADRRLLAALDQVIQTSTLKETA